MERIPSHLIFPIVILLAIADVIGLLGWNTPLFLALQQVFGYLPDAWWSSVTILGDSLVVMALLPVLALRRPAILPLGLLAGLLATLLNRPLKMWLNVDRPFLALGDQVHVIGVHLQHLSFPSGHTTAIFMLAGLYALFYSPQRPWNAVTLLAVLTGLSRIAVGAHWPMDVCAGAAAGWTGALIAWRLDQHWQWTARVAQSRAWQLGLWTVALLASTTLFWMQTGYPLAQPWQYLLATLTTAAAILGLWKSWHNRQP